MLSITGHNSEGIGATNSYSGSLAGHNSEGIGATNSHSGSLAGQPIINRFPTYNKGATYTDKSACGYMIATQCCTIIKRYFIQS